MARTLNITEAERVEAGRRIENFFAFTRDVLADSSVLDELPDESQVEVIPKTQRDSDRRYDNETPNTVVMVTPIEHDTPSRRRLV